MTDDQETTLAQQFANQQNKNEIVEVLKELFDEQKLKMITDLEPDEIRLITRIKGIAQMKDLKVWDDMCDIYMALLLSKKRKSRWEIIDGIKGFQQRISGLGRLNPANWGSGGQGRGRY